MHPAQNPKRQVLAALLLAGLCAGALPAAQAQLNQSQESPGQRALREQAQRNGTWTPPPPGLSDQERIWRDQQQMQREQWRQQREQTRQDDQRIRQESESPGQRALREQAQNRREQGRMAAPR
ncbi:MAG: hypothetical protein V4706_17700 [Pseudomonadota bacterium]